MRAAATTALTKSLTLQLAFSKTQGFVRPGIARKCHPGTTKPANTTDETPTLACATSAATIQAATA